MPGLSHPWSALKEHNDIPLDQTILYLALQDLSARLLRHFGKRVRLIVHGGAVMVLHPNLRSRKHTPDVDYNHRSFVAEWQMRGVADAGTQLQACIWKTALKFGLGADWMNAHADVALPLARDVNGKLYDPVWADAMTPMNRRLNTIFSSPGLVLVAVSWPWAVALKLVRFQKHDPEDIANILRLGRSQRGTVWTRHVLETWLVRSCGAMGYHAYLPWRIDATRQNMRCAIRLAEMLSP
ncbi:hypothetical protein BKA93DRAFT_816389 [Sparassis latifolia]